MTVQTQHPWLQPSINNCAVHITSGGLAYSLGLWFTLGGVVHSVFPRKGKLNSNRENEHPLL